MNGSDRKPRAFFLYRDSPLRREALGRPVGAAQRYSLYGLDEIAEGGFDVHHNLEPGGMARAWPRIGGATLDRAVRLAGGYSGDFGSVLASRRVLNHADVVFSTVDTVGIPLVLLARARLVRAPIVYAAIGLRERVEHLEPRAAEVYRNAYRRLRAIVAYGWGEVEALRSWLGEHGPPVHFVPFGVDTEAFRPAPEALPDVDIVSVGADPRRDFRLLLALAEGRPRWSFRIVASRDHAGVLARTPPNVHVEFDLPFDEARARLTAAKVVVLPVRDNSYSGATTVLLQAMASAKPVVVTRTAAIARGYHLEDGLNCRLVPPGAFAALEHAASDLLGDAERAALVGARARATVERHLSWQRYTGAIRELLLAACDTTTVPA
jgi:glycosyltransferase involved in cell wall biosynthesis